MKPVWARTLLFRRLTDANVKIWKTRHKISADRGIYADIFCSVLRGRRPTSHHASRSLSPSVDRHDAERGGQRSAAGAGGGERPRSGRVRGSAPTTSSVHDDVDQHQHRRRRRRRRRCCSSVRHVIIRRRAASSAEVRQNFTTDRTTSRRRAQADTPRLRVIWPQHRCTGRTVKNIRISTDILQSCIVGFAFC